ncbi:MAG: hypothetical protein ACI9MC_002041 [Kiritimatiellia bacterium]|jgi:hypothetical protein
MRSSLWLPGLCLGLLLLCAPTSWQSGDAYTYVADAAIGEQLIHPHHLIFNLILSLGAPWGVPGVLWAGKVHNALAGGLTVGFMGLALRGASVPKLGAVGLLWALVGTRAMLGDMGLLVPYAGLLMGSALAAWGMASERPWLAAFGCVVAYLYHQTGVLLLLPALLSLRGRSWPLLGAAGAMGVAQIVGWWWRAPEQDLLTWSVLYAQGSNPAWGHQLTSAYQAPLSLVRQIVWLGDGWTRVLSLPVVMLLAWGAFRLRSRWRQALPWVAWLAVHLTFFAWWMPSWRWFFTPALLPLLMLAAIAQLPRRVVVTVALVLIAWNLPNAWGPSVYDLSPSAERADDLAAYRGPCSAVGSRWTVEALWVRHGLPAALRERRTVQGCVVMHRDDVVGSARRPLDSDPTLIEVK